MKFKEWVMLPAGYQPDTKDTREEYPPGTYAKYYHEAEYEKLQLEAIADHIDMRKFQAKYIEADHELIAVKAELEKEREKVTQLKIAVNKADEIIKVRDQLKAQLSIAANRLEAVANGIQAHGTNINPEWWIEQYNKYADEAREAQEQK